MSHKFPPNCIYVAFFAFQSQSRLCASPLMVSNILRVCLTFRLRVHNVSKPSSKPAPVVLSKQRCVSWDPNESDLLVMVNASGQPLRLMGRILIFCCPRWRLQLQLPDLHSVFESFFLGATWCLLFLCRHSLKSSPLMFLGSDPNTCISSDLHFLSLLSH